MHIKILEAVAIGLLFLFIGLYMGTEIDEHTPLPADGATKYQKCVTIIQDHAKGMDQ